MANGESGEVVQDSMSDLQAIREIIHAHNVNLVKWYAEGDIDKVVEVFTEDCWQMPPNAQPLIGREALREGWKQSMAWGQWDFTLEDLDVEASGNIAVERGRYILKFTAGSDAPPGMSSFEDKGNYVVLWRHESDGEWRIVWDAPVSELPHPGMP
jgi:ketosteroid isomerase-like protein